MSSRRESNPNLDRSRPDLYNDTTTNQRINRLRDLRNKLESSNPLSILDGNIDEFIEEGIKNKK